MVFKKSKMVTRTLSLALAMVVMVSPSKAHSADFERVITLNQFKKALIGKTIKGGGINVVIHTDGTVTGTASHGRKIALNWRWQFGHWCRNGTIGSETLADDCQQVWLKCKILRLVRNWGRGPVVEYRVPNPQQKNCSQPIAAHTLHMQKRNRDIL